MTNQKKKITISVGREFKKVSPTYGRYGGYDVVIDVDVKLDDLIERLQKLKEEYSKTFDSLEVRLVQIDYSDYYQVVLFGQRLENDEEYEVRIAKEADNKLQMEEWERKQFEELQKKYGSK